MNQHDRYRISVWGTGNVALRLSVALKDAGHSLEYICGRDVESGNKIVRILNRSGNKPDCSFTTDYTCLKESEVVVIAVSDDAIKELSEKFATLFDTRQDQYTGMAEPPLVVHTSGASPATVLASNSRYGVLYPLMTLSKIKPVDFRLVPFLLEGSDSVAEKILSSIVFSLGSEYHFCNSAERLRTHVAAVYISNFINYLAGLAFEISKPNQTLLLPLAIETVRKAFLYENPFDVQTGPARRGDIETICKHLEILGKYPEHRHLYIEITNLILERSGFEKIKI
ncbi:MAG: DUF2520 domain-containing protein [Bacteroidales bacterium]|nr:DUF2520 domain-containing protein [Bacteroidales bacterium]MDD2424530.1 DUF2520 domain-containing protein [Bacteroidales bacterium]MDD3988488.1 DUF2520 domain-containing protein [Bacteroidales bacterium]MDD4639510.1 DUF2520 domain-containing protein [Bacteroidales bacterium]